MAKEKLGSKSLLYPCPVVILGANVNGKPNYMTLAFVGIVNMNPGMVAMGVARSHYTHIGIKENQTFSLNAPGKDMLEVTDYVGIASGAKTDKSGIFESFYGTLKTAPMIKECPLNLECRVLKMLDLGGVDDVIIGEVVESYCEETRLTNGNPDLEKLDLSVFSMGANQYFSIGKPLGKAWKIGKGYKPER